ncbi:MAG TPA: DinB family protein [Actinomycetota bacterium]|jgi:hypothetical protein
MAQPTRQEAISVLNEGHAEIHRLLDGIPEAELVRLGTIGGGEWSAKDLIGHIATWEELAVRTLEEWRRGEKPWVEHDDGPFGDSGQDGIDAFNAQNIDKKRPLSLRDVQNEADAIHDRLIDAIDGLPDEAWRAKATYPTSQDRRRTLSALLGGILGAPKRPFGHAFAHLPDAESFAASIRPTGV